MRCLNFSCQCCRFVAKPNVTVPSAGLEFVEIHGKLFLLCLMCAQSQLLTRPVQSPSQEGELNHGRLVYCPWFSQGKIISVVRDIYALQHYQKGKNNRALRSYVDELRQGFIHRLINACKNLPTLKIANNDLVGYAHLYLYASPELLNNEMKVFGGVRYIPDEAQFSQAVLFWTGTSYKTSFLL